MQYAGLYTCDRYRFTQPSIKISYLKIICFVTWADCKLWAFSSPKVKRVIARSALLHATYFLPRMNRDLMWHSSLLLGVNAQAQTSNPIPLSLAPTWDIYLLLQRRRILKWCLWFVPSQAGAACSFLRATVLCSSCSSCSLWCYSPIVFIFGHLLSGPSAFRQSNFYCACALLLPEAASCLRWRDEEMNLFFVREHFTPLSNRWP